MKLIAFYHLWAGVGSHWHEPTQEFFDAMTTSQWPGEVRVNVVYDGYEQETLDIIRDYAQDNDAYVLYAHTKGAYNMKQEQFDINVPWRRAMYKYVVANWRECVKALDDGYDVAGIHWFHPSMNGVVHAAHFGGNVWMAKTAHLRTLPVCLRQSRWDAEIWLGINNPKAIDLFPGHNPTWPNIQRYAELGIT